MSSTQEAGKEKSAVKRKCFTREYKLRVVKWYSENGKNIAHTAHNFNVNRKSVRTWVNKVDFIQESKYRTQKIKSGRKAKYPIAESKLHEEFKKMRREGRPVKRYWFNLKMSQLVKEHHPDTAGDFRHSDQWFAAFQRRWKISLRAKTHTSQKSPADCVGIIQNFHRGLLFLRKMGTYKLCDIANMDQTPLPFILEDGKTYNKSGEKHIWCASGASGLSKRQCTVQLTIFADGVPRIKPLLIFRGKGLRIKKTEKDKWDKRVTVCFQKDAWCDEIVMKNWVKSEWNNYFTNPPTPGSDGKLLVADIHRAQQTPGVKDLLAKCKTKLVNVPGGTTAYVQVLDVVVNAPYKNTVKRLSQTHMQENLEKYVNAKLSASDRRVLITEWCGEAWQKIDSESVKRGFKKCGISINVDGSENDLVRIEKLPDYVMPSIDSDDDEYSLVETDDEDEENEPIDRQEYVSDADSDDDDASLGSEDGSGSISDANNGDDDASLGSEDGSGRISDANNDDDDASLGSEDGSGHISDADNDDDDASLGSEDGSGRISDANNGDDDASLGSEDGSGSISDANNDDDDASLGSEDGSGRISDANNDDNDVSLASGDGNLSFKERVLSLLLLQKGDYVKVVQGNYKNYYALVQSVKEDEIHITYFKETKGKPYGIYYVVADNDVDTRSCYELEKVEPVVIDLRGRYVF